MSEQVSRIRGRQGEPLELILSQQTLFLDLPLEIRDHIYYHAVVHSDPICVWYGWSVESSGAPTWRGLHNDYVHRQVVTCAYYRSSLPLARSLLLCNQQISRETAAVLYRCNEFRFCGESVWKPLYAFLHMIGIENRKCLRRISVDVHKPRKVRQHADGTRTSLEPWYSCEVIPFNGGLQRDSARLQEGEVDYVDPVIEACFRILGANGSPLRLALQLQPDYLPGVQVAVDELFPDRYVFGMDVPFAMERFRQGCTSSPGTGCRVAVVWRGSCATDPLYDRLQLVEQVGWEFVETRKKTIVKHTGLVNISHFELRLRAGSTT